jgi:hypothetical protein
MSDDEESISSDLTLEFVDDERDQETEYHDDHEEETPELEYEHQAAATMAEIEIGGVKYQQVASKRTVTNHVEQVLHKKQDRASLTSDDRTSLFEKAVKKGHKLFDVVPLALNDEDKLDDTYNLDVLIRKMKRLHFMYDMHDVFVIIYPNANNDSQVETTKDLYTEYAQITVADVARSNLWYREWLSDTWFEQNLQLSHDYFQNNTSDDLWMKVSESYDNYKASEQGGPLFFILMMNHLLSDTEEAAASLVKRVTEFKITNIRGEDIYKVVSLLRGAVNRLTYIKLLPKDIIKLLLTVMQTSSVISFNETFHLLQKDRKQAAVLRKTGPTSGITIPEIFLLAESEYRELVEESKWNGVSTTGTKSIFAAGTPGNPGPSGKTIVCFNCGGSHILTSCPTPKDEQRILANRTKFFDQKKKTPLSPRSDGKGKPKGGTDGRTKWKAPTKEENGKRVINGKPHWYHFKNRRWNVESTGGPPKPPGVNTAAVTPPAAGTTPTAGTASVVPPAAADKQATIQLALANSQKQINAAFAGMVNAFT